MFRTSNIRGKERFESVRGLLGPKPAVLQLSGAQVQLIEESSVITLGEKIELLLVVVGNKLTTELFQTVEYAIDRENKKEQATRSSLERIRYLLDQLPFDYFLDGVEKTNRRTRKPQFFEWFQVSCNTAVSHFLKRYPDDLTEFEEGVLYGFPLSAIRAYAGLISTRDDKPTPSSYFLAGVLSADFWEEELQYYEYWWEKLRRLSPSLIDEAEQQFWNSKKLNPPPHS